MQDNERTVCTFWIFKRHNDLLTWCQISKFRQIFCHRLTCTSNAVSMQEAVCQEIFHDSWHSTNLVKVLEDILTGRFQVSQMWHLLLNDIEVIKCQLDIGRVSHGQQVQGSISRTTQSHGHRDCIFKGFTCQDVRRLQPHFQHFHNSTTSCFDILLLVLGLSRVRRGAWQTHA